MKRLLRLAVLVLASMNCHAQTEVTNFVPGSTLDGVNYFLPRTAFRVVVEAEKTVTKPGELYKYAFRYLRMKDVPSAETTAWRITKVTLEPYGVPDKTKAYNIKIKSKTIAPLVSLTRDGILLSINKDTNERMLPALPQGTAATPVIDPKEFMNQEMLSAGSTAKLAELCAQEIYDIRESRNALVRGEADNTPKDGAQLKLMLDQLDMQANALEQLFKGSIQTSTHVFSLNITPNNEGEQILFRFSKILGLVDSDDLAGSPVYLDIKNTENLPQAVEDPIADKKKEKLEKGIYYNVPAREAIRIFDDNETYFKGEIPMGQFGRVEILSDALFNKNVSTKVSFFQTTGGVEKVEN